MMFNLAINDLVTRLNTVTHAPAFADDIIVRIDSRQMLREVKQIFEEEGPPVGFRINYIKSNLLVVVPLYSSRKPIYGLPG
jgi:hypothetical protein